MTIRPGRRQHPIRNLIRDPGMIAALDRFQLKTLSLALLRYQ